MWDLGNHSQWSVLVCGAYGVGGPWRLIRRCACVLEIGEKHLHILEMIAFVIFNIQVLLVPFSGNFFFSSAGSFASLPLSIGSSKAGTRNDAVLSSRL